jgi:hypothetical protein
MQGTRKQHYCLYRIEELLLCEIVYIFLNSVQILFLLGKFAGLLNLEVYLILRKYTSIEKIKSFSQ